jgi:hypothetical protein
MSKINQLNLTHLFIISMLLNLAYGMNNILNILF